MTKIYDFFSDYSKRIIWIHEIGLRLAAKGYIIILFPRLEVIINRYSDRKVYLPYRFEIGEMLHATVGKEFLINETS